VTHTGHKTQLFVIRRYRIIITVRGGTRDGQTQKNNSAFLWSSSSRIEFHVRSYHTTTSTYTRSQPSVINSHHDDIARLEACPDDSTSSMCRHCLSTDGPMGTLRNDVLSENNAMTHRRSRRGLTPYRPHGLVVQRQTVRRSRRSVSFVYRVPLCCVVFRFASVSPVVL